MAEAIANVERMRDYLANRLSDDEARDFEARLLREPGLVSELELALRLRAGLSELAERGRLARLIRDPNRKRGWWPLVAVAATIGVLAVSLWAFHAARELLPSATLTSGSSTGVSAQYTFRAMRGTGQTPVLELPTTGEIELAAAPVVLGASARYEVSLAQVGADGRRTEVASLSNLVPDDRGLIHCYVKASRLTPDTYVLVISPSGQPAADSEAFMFALARAANGNSP